MQEEIKDTIYLSVGLIILAMVLGFVAILLDVRGDIASIVNDNYGTKAKVEEYRQFNKFDNTTVYGDDVIELVRLYYDSGLDIYINKTSNADTNGLRINSLTVREDASLASLQFLRTKLDTKKKFKSFLVYDSYNPELVSDKMTPKSYSEVTGITLILKP